MRAITQAVASLSSFVALGELAAARTGNGALVFCVPLDYLVWTEPMAQFITAANKVIDEAGAQEKQLWVTGSLSARGAQGNGKSRVAGARAQRGASVQVDRGPSEVGPHPIRLSSAAQAPRVAVTSSSATEGPQWHAVVIAMQSLCVTATAWRHKGERLSDTTKTCTRPAYSAP